MKFLEENNFGEEVKNHLEEILEENIILITECESLRNIGRNLKEEIRFLKAKIEKYETEKFKPKFCIHCKSEYNPTYNENVNFLKKFKI